jgi:hypothetical protein
MNDKPESYGKTETAPRVVSSALFGVTSQFGSGNECASQDMGTSENPSTDDDVSLSLPQVLGLLSCPESSERHLNNLAKTLRERSEWEALLRLWKSLDHPCSQFWSEIRVNYNRIVRSYQITPNDPAQTPPDE